MLDNEKFQKVVIRDIFEDYISVDCAKSIADFVNHEHDRGVSVDFATILGAFMAYWYDTTKRLETDPLKAALTRDILASRG